MLNNHFKDFHDQETQQKHQTFTFGKQQEQKEAHDIAGPLVA